MPISSGGPNLTQNTYKLYYITVNHFYVYENLYLVLRELLGQRPAVLRELLSSGKYYVSIRII